MNKKIYGAIALSLLTTNVLAIDIESMSKLDIKKHKQCLMYSKKIYHQ